jgi:hypothetical protein
MTNDTGTTGRKKASAENLPAINTIASGRVVAILLSTNEVSLPRLPNLPHAVLVRFGNHIGMLRARDMDDESQIKRIARGAEITALVTKTGINKKGEPVIDLSQKKLTMFTKLSALVGKRVVGKVVRTAYFGAFFAIGDDLPLGLCPIAELAAVNQKERLASLVKDEELTVFVTSVGPDPKRPGEYHVNLSELRLYVSEEDHARLGKLMVTNEVDSLGLTDDEVHRAMGIA